MHLIGLCGFKGVGKSTIAARMVEIGFERLSFATPIKRALTAMFKVDFERLSTEEKETPMPGIGLAPRYLMQTLGTEWGRARDPELWLKLMRQELEWRRKPPFVGPAAEVVIDDVRFDNEAVLIKEMGGHVLQVKRKGFAPAQDGHSSEKGVNESFIDGTIDVGRREPGTLKFNSCVITSLLPYLSKR